MGDLHLSWKPRLDSVAEYRIEQIPFPRTAESRNRMPIHPYTWIHIGYRQHSDRTDYSLVRGESVQFPNLGKAPPIPEKYRVAIGDFLSRIIHNNNSLEQLPGQDRNVG